MRPPPLPPKLLRASDSAGEMALWCAYLEACQALWRQLVGTPAFCRYVLLLDHAELLLQPALQALQQALEKLTSGAANIFVPPALPLPAPPSARDLARQAPRKGATRNGPTLPLSLPLGRARATRQRPPKLVTAPRSITSTPPSATPSAAAAQVLRRSPSSRVPTTAPPAHALPAHVERPWALLCGGDWQLRCALHAAPRQAGKAPNAPEPTGTLLWRRLQPLLLTALQPAEVQALCRLGGFEQASSVVQWCIEHTGGHPFMLQCALANLTTLLTTTSMQTPEATLLAQLQDVLLPQLLPCLTQMLAQFPTPSLLQPEPAAHTLMRLLLAHDTAPVSLDLCRNSLGTMALQPSLDLLLMLAVAQRRQYRNDLCLQASCPLWNNFYAQNA